MTINKKVLEHFNMVSSMPNTRENLTSERFQTRCEADHKDGKVCQTVLVPITGMGSICPKSYDHADYGNQ